MVESLRGFLVTKDFVNRLSVIEERTRDLLQYWQAHAPHYTDHGRAHCEAVEKNLDEIILDDIKTSMNEYEIFLLLLGVSLHDIGIMCATTSDEENKKIRDTHHERSKQFVLNRLRDILSGAERHIVGEICLAHRDFVPLGNIEKAKTIRHSSLGNMDVRGRFLAGLLRLADACDICHTRTSEDLVAVSKPPKSSDFYHALHERVSGIRFDADEKVIYIDFNIASTREKDICKEYLVDNIQRNLNSVRDCLTRNRVIYINVEPKFSMTDTLTSTLRKPRKVKKPKPTSELGKLVKKAHSFYLKDEHEKSLEILEKVSKKLPNSAALWSIKADVYFSLGNMKEAQKAHDKCLEIDNENATFLGSAGHFYGEYLLDIEKSFELLEKAYQIQPKDGTNRLNYAEALVTVGKAQQAYNVATKYLQECNEVDKALNAKFISVHALFFLGNKEEGLKKLKDLVMFFGSCPLSIEETNRWSYNKIRKYITTSKLEKNIKKNLTDTIDLLELKLTVEKFEKKHKKIFKT